MIREQRSFFDCIASRWDIDHCPPEDQLRLERIIEEFGLKSGSRVLDAGCGTGRLAPVIRRAIGPFGSLAEIDFSLPMLLEAQKKRFPAPNWLLQADVEALPFGDSSFDAVVAFALFPHIQDKTRALSEFRRVLKPGKMIYILHLLGREEMNRLHSGMEGCVRHDRIPEESVMQSLFTRGGFSNVTIEDRPDLYLARSQA